MTVTSRRQVCRYVTGSAQHVMSCLLLFNVKRLTLASPLQPITTGVTPDGLKLQSGASPGRKQWGGQKARVNSWRSRSASL